MIGWVVQGCEEGNWRCASSRSMKASGRVTAACAGFLGCTDLLSSHFAKPFYVCTGKLLHSSVFVTFALCAEFPCAAKFIARVSKLSVPSDPGKFVLQSMTGSDAPDQYWVEESPVKPW